MAINAYEVEKGIIAALQASITVRSALGDPVRIRKVPEPGIAFPWARMQMFQAVRSEHAVIGSSRTQLKIHVVRHVVYSLKLDQEPVADAIEAIMAVMEEAQANVTVTGSRIIDSQYAGHHVDYDTEGESPGGVFGFCQYDLLMQD